MRYLLLLCMLIPVAGYSAEEACSINVQVTNTSKHTWDNIRNEYYEPDDNGCRAEFTVNIDREPVNVSFYLRGRIAGNQDKVCSLARWKGIEWALDQRPHAVSARSTTRCRG